MNHIKPIQGENEPKEIFRRRYIKWLNFNKVFNYEYPDSPLPQNNLEIKK